MQPHAACYQTKPDLKVLDQTRLASADNFFQGLSGIAWMDTEANCIGDRVVLENLSNTLSNLLHSHTTRLIPPKIPTSATADCKVRGTRCWKTLSMLDGPGLEPSRSLKYRTGTQYVGDRTIEYSTDGS